MIPICRISALYVKQEPEGKEDHHIHRREQETSERDVIDLTVRIT